MALQGLNVLVLEREAKIYHLPRAVHFDDEVMRVFQTVGIADDLLPLVHVNPGMKFVDQSGTALLDWPRPQEITEHGWNASYRLHQPDLERLLRDKLANYEKITVASETMVTALSSSPDHVEIETWPGKMLRAHKSIRPVTWSAVMERIRSSDSQWAAR